MRRLAVSSAIDTYLDEIVYSEARLAAEAVTSALATPFGEELARGETLLGRQRQASRLVVRSEAALATADLALDRATTRFAAELLLAVNQNREAPLFRRLFPRAPNELIRRGLRQQCEHTRTVILPELARLPEGDALRAHLPLLEQAVARAEAALEARSQAKAQRGLLALDVEEYKEGVNRLRLSAYAALLRLAAEQGLGRSWAESFFRPAKRQEDEETQEQEVGVGEGTGA